MMFTKSQVQAMVVIAVKNGTLIRPDSCSKCGKKPPKNTRGQSTIHAHHHNGYGPGHELDIVWLCASCHRLCHQGPNEWTKERRETAANRAANRTGWNHTKEARKKIKAKRASQIIKGRKCEPGCTCRRHTESGNWAKVDPD